MTAFYKVSGSGNDFLALAEPGAPPAPELIAAWCRRGVSLGADGLFVLRRKPEAPGAPPAADMDYFNSDGLPADLCMNGTRCAAQLAFHLGWAEDTVRVTTPAGTFVARRLGDAKVAVDLPSPGGSPREMEIEADGAGNRSHRGWSLMVGVPHFVLLWPEGLERAPVERLGRAIRNHPSFAPAGTNVNFVRFPAEHRMEIRTYERGVEGETLSCGTGVLASAAVGLAKGAGRLPLQVLTRGGFELEVSEERAGIWSLTGDARVVAQGDLLPGAGPAPAAPSWV